MAKRIGVLEPDQAPTDSPAFFEKRSIACRMVRQMEAVWIVKNRLIQRIIVKARRIAEQIRKFWDGPLGVGNLLPFAKAHNYGDKLHYEMPMANDIGMRRHGLYRRNGQLLNHKIRVSARSRAFHLDSAPRSGATHTLASGLLAG